MHGGEESPWVRLYREGGTSLFVNGISVTCPGNRGWADRPCEQQTQAKAAKPRPSTIFGLETQFGTLVICDGQLATNFGRQRKLTALGAFTEAAEFGI